MGLQILREHMVELSLARVGVGESVTVRAHVARMFRPQRLIIVRTSKVSKNSRDLVLTSVKIDDDEVMPKAITSLPVALFAPEAVAIRLPFWTGRAGCEIAITLKDDASSDWSLRRAVRRLTGHKRRLKVFVVGVEVSTLADHMQGAVSLGVTATPMRPDGQRVSSLFGKN